MSFCAFFQTFYGLRIQVSNQKITQGGLLFDIKMISYLGDRFNRFFPERIIPAPT